MEGGARRRPQPRRGAGRRRAPATPTRPTRSAYAEAIEGGAERIALVGMGCQASAPAVMAARKAGKVARRFALTIGLLCSKTFDDAIFAELFEARYGLRTRGHREDEHQGRLPGLDPRRRATTRSRSKRPTPWTREGCKHCPDFAAEHADISTGGIGAFNDWTLTIVRTDAGPRAHLTRWWRPARSRSARVDDDPEAVALCASSPGSAGAVARDGRQAPRQDPGRQRLSRLPYAPSSRARASTSSNISAVSSPVKTLRWLGWYEHTSRESDPSLAAGSLCGHPRRWSGDLEPMRETCPPYPIAPRRDATAPRRQRPRARGATRALTRRSSSDAR